jgi:hypothetical protein
VIWGYHAAKDAVAAKDYKTAIRGFIATVDALPDGDRDKSAAAYDVACAASLAGDVDQGYEWLEKARGFGWNNAGHARRDPDLENLRKDNARFEAIVNKMKME